MFEKEKLIKGVQQREFTITVAGDNVPCVIWAPEDASGPRNLLLMGHGGSQHKKILGIRRRAIDYANKYGWATLAIDAPGHGDRITREAAALLMAEVGARVTGQSSEPVNDPQRMKVMAKRSEQAVPEWQAALDAVQQFDFVGDTGMIGYWGVSMGTAIGVPLLAAEPRISCAVLGLAGMREGDSVFRKAAEAIHIPVQFVFQWEDAVAPRQAGIELFNAFASVAKTMHINPGGHVDIPDFESHAWESFYVRHLGA